MPRIREALWRPSHAAGFVEERSSLRAGRWRVRRARDFHPDGRRRGWPTSQNDLVLCRPAARKPDRRGCGNTRHPRAPRLWAGRRKHCGLAINREKIRSPISLLCHVSLNDQGTWVVLIGAMPGRSQAARYGAARDRKSRGATERIRIVLQAFLIAAARASSAAPSVLREVAMFMRMWFSPPAP